jgi:phosphomannomutase/phosphoglucomutase
VDAILEHVDVPAIKRAGLKVTVDCANGASSVTAPLLLKKLGVVAVTLNANQQGEFPGRPNEPTEDNIHNLITLTKSSKSNLGMAHDADGDRSIFVTGKGKFVSGDVSLAVMAKYVLSKHPGAVVTPVSSSSVVQDVVSANGGTVVYTPVGSPIVSKKMKETSAVLGGEENGGLIFPEHQFCRDAAMALAKMLECIAVNGPLQKQVDSMPVYYMEKREIDCEEDKKAALLGYMRELNTGEIMDETDGIKTIFDDGWVLARPSGTEPKFRIFSESKDKDVAKKRADDLEAEAEKFISVI